MILGDRLLLFVLVKFRKFLFRGAFASLQWKLRDLQKIGLNLTVFRDVSESGLHEIVKLIVEFFRRAPFLGPRER